MALLDEMSTRLIGQSVGVTGSTANWVVKKGWMPPAPDRAIGIFETGGRPNDPGQGLVDRPTFQVRIRGPKGGYSTMRSKVAAARVALETGPLTLQNRYYVQIVADSEPVFLGYDANQRPEMVQNYTAWRSRTT